MEKTRRLACRGSGMAVYSQMFGRGGVLHGHSVYRSADFCPCATTLHQPQDQAGALKSRGEGLDCDRVWALCALSQPATRRLTPCRR
ncbi:hypothetical protein FVE85_9183 [Porphyridium purpureum]|uniref:Uncharacterized protein n=1 Tax=Porphyridium purpureum TaxID=35688 RepID=A0A5J4YN32_PORPP|nr:hypothetical protein FVE85_9183 [Porphyridium purpureum]|eukprot:POR8985..scf222_8